MDAFSMRGINWAIGEDAVCSRVDRDRLRTLRKSHNDPSEHSTQRSRTVQFGGIRGL